MEQQTVLENVCRRTLEDLDAIQSLRDEGTEIEQRYHYVSYEDLATDTLSTVMAVHKFMGVEYVDSFERIKEDMSWKAGDSPPAFGSIRALSNANFIKRAIDVHFPENGAGIGEGGTKTSYSTSRAQVVCGECDERVTSETNAIDACRSVVSRLGLRCCS